MLCYVVLLCRYDVMLVLLFYVEVFWYGVMMCCYVLLPYVVMLLRGCVGVMLCYAVLLLC